MTFRLEDNFVLLERTPCVLNAWLSGLPRPWIMRNYGQGSFSPHDIVGHLVHGEQVDWVPRALMILDEGESRTFDPFVIEEMRGVMEGLGIEDLLDDFARLRGENIEAMRDLNLTPDDLTRCGTHPALGTVSLGQLIATWVAHDLHHLAQIAKAMSFQQRNEVGPWRAYLSIIPPGSESSAST